ncbi:MAG: thioredoxin [Puniceicoccales bacterium]|jgi:thioredoxin 1|nr:thioredoxin [Puniceicoccales bacterium]
MASDKIIHLDTASFDNVVSTTPLLVVDLWAPWCGPCKALGPVLDQIAEELGDTVKIAKVNVDDSRDLAQRYSVTAIPTFLFFKGGVLAETLVGAQPKATYLAAIKKLQ